MRSVEAIWIKAFKKESVMRKSQEEVFAAFIELLLAGGTAKPGWRLDFAAENGILAEEIDQLAVYVKERF